MFMLMIERTRLTRNTSCKERSARTGNDVAGLRRERFVDWEVTKDLGRLRMQEHPR